MRINIKVKASSGRQEVERISDNDYLVSLKSPAREGKANSELLKVLRRYFGSGVRIVSGKTSRRKVVEVLEYKD